MPIGSRSYYDSVGATDKKAQPQKRGFFQKNDVQTHSAQAASSGKTGSSIAPAMRGPAKKRRSPGAPKPSYYAPPPAAPIDSVVSQIVDLAGRVGGILTQAEDLVKRAELVMANAQAAVDRADAAAMRAEIAASRAQLSVLTSGPAAADSTSPDTTMVEPTVVEPVAIPDPVTALQEKLRSGLLQLDHLSAPVDRPLDAPVLNIGAADSNGAFSDQSESPRDMNAAAPPVGIVTDGPNSFSHEVGMKGGMSGFMTTRDRRAGLQPQEGNGRDSVAHGLVSLSYGSEIPRVSPFILSTASGSDTPAESDEIDSNGSHTDDKSLGMAV